MAAVERWFVYTYRGVFDEIDGSVVDESDRARHSLVLVLTTY